MGDDSTYVCPQCGPDPRGSQVHTEEMHTWHGGDPEREEQLAAENARLRQLAEATEAMTALAPYSLGAEVDRLQARLDTATAHVEELRGQRDFAKAEVAAVRKDWEDATGESDAHRTKYLELAGDLASAIRERNHYQGYAEALNADLTERNAECDAMRPVVEAAEAYVEARFTSGAGAAGNVLTNAVDAWRAAQPDQAARLTAAEVNERQLRASLVQCCEAGMVAYPEPCPWHGGQKTPGMIDPADLAIPDLADDERQAFLDAASDDRSSPPGSTEADDQVADDGAGTEGLQAQGFAQGPDWHRRYEAIISKAFENLQTDTTITRDDVDAILTWVGDDYAALAAPHLRAAALNEAADGVRALGDEYFTTAKQLTEPAAGRNRSFAYGVFAAADWLRERAGREAT